MASASTSVAPHCLSLKVLRTSHPSLFNSQLQLASAFGQIYLGETFSTLIAIENLSGEFVKNPILRVELQTSTNKLFLKNIEIDRIESGKSLEGRIESEIKELGLTSLICTCTYGLEDGTSRSFRKVYKFTVSNPLSVRTKAHSPTPTSSSSFLVQSEREKVFLEVQIQNQTESAITFGRMEFMPLPNWQLQSLDSFDELNSGLMSPGSIRQYIFILLANDIGVLGIAGESQALGRLNIKWSGPNGEAGSLTTSLLGRKVPSFDPTSLGAVEEKRRLTLEDSKENRRDSIDSIRSDHSIISRIKSPIPYRNSNLSNSTSTPLENSPSRSGPIKSIPPAVIIPPKKQSTLLLDFTVSKILSPVHLEIPFTIQFNFSLSSTLVSTKSRNVKLRIEIFDKDTEILPVLQVIEMSRTRSISAISNVTISNNNATNSIKRIGSSSIILPNFLFPANPDSISTVPTLSDTPTPIASLTIPSKSKSISQSCEVVFLAFNPGLFRVGGIRVRIIADDSIEDEENEKQEELVIFELETFSEVWVER